MDESERYDKGEHATYEDAAAACKTIVDDYLVHTYKKGMTADELYESYIDFGEDPFIIPDDKSERFSAWNYAKRRCQELA